VAMAPRYAAVRADYERVLKQRTALLKSAGPKGGPKGNRQSREAVTATLDVWDAHLARTGAELLVAREHLVQAIRPHVERAYLAVAGDGRGPAEIAYRRSFEAPDEITAGGRPAGATDSGLAARADVIHREHPAGGTDGGLAAPTADDHGERAIAADGGAAVNHGERAGTTDGGAVVSHRERQNMTHGERVRAAEKSLRAALLEVRSSELDRGVCLAGPHRDELELSIRGLPARGYASHGESWSLALALRLASFDLLRSGREDPVLILDDVFAELDAGRRDRLAALVATAEQVLVTAAVPADVPDILTGARFTVAAGGLTPVRDPTAAYATEDTVAELADGEAAADEP
jgi:DNA replication and repair protein RecF